MRALSSRVALAAILLSIATAAQAETWWTYRANFNGKSGMVTVDMGLRPRVPVKGYEHVIVTGIDYDVIRPDGLPDPQTIDAMNKVTPAIADAIKATSPMIFAGRFIGGGQIRLYFYVQEATSIDDVLEGIYSTSCPICRADTQINDDATWSAYSKYLYPNPATRKFYADDLQKLGVAPD